MDLVRRGTVSLLAITAVVGGAMAQAPSTTPPSTSQGSQAYVLVFRDGGKATKADTIPWTLINVSGAPKGMAFDLYALDKGLDLPATATKDELLKAMEGHVVGKAAYVGRSRTP
jgi:phosphatidylethanolamine-binding protein (PEBP) family uncharacterized protein